MTEVALRVDNIRKFYMQKHNKKMVAKSVNGVSFSIKSGEVLAIIGESGCGKSTMGRVLTGLEKASEGSVYLYNEDIVDIKRKSNREFHKRVQMIFQNPFDTFDPHYKMKNIFLGTLKLHKIGKNTSERLAYIKQEFEKAGLSPAENYLDRYPGELSGGQLQRMSILRCMMLKPDFIVADEPVSMLDVSIRAEILIMIQKMAKENQTAVLFISHDLATTRYIADSIAVMYLGKIVEIGETETIINHAVHPYTKALISNCGSVNPREKINKIILKGAPPSPVALYEGCYFADRCPYAREECKKEKACLWVVKNSTPGHLARCTIFNG